MPINRCRALPASILTGIRVCVAALVPACTVMESREPCPCVLRLDVRETEASLLTVWSEGTVFFSGRISGTEEEYAVEVPRTRLFVEVAEGVPDSFPAVGVEIPLGEDCPPVRIFRDTLEAGGEDVSVKVVPLRQYCELTLEGDVDADLRVEGDVCGFSAEGQPFPGPFAHSFSFSDGKASVRLPRQVPAGERDPSEAGRLALRVTAGDAVSDFDLAAVLAAVGYDWTEPDLPPLTLRLDLARTSLLLISDPWNETDSRQVVLGDSLGNHRQMSLSCCFFRN